MMRAVIHGILHLLVPALVARAAFPARWRRAWLLMLAGLLIDLDHLLATPIFDPGRCSIGFHPLHTPVAIACYVALTVWRRTRVVGIGLLVHVLLDALDCVWM